MAQDERPPSFERFDAELARFRERRRRRAARSGRKRARSAYSSGLQAGIEIFAGLLGGLALGYALDAWTGLRPLFLVLFLILGGAAGLLNAYRELRRMDGTPGERRRDGQQGNGASGGRDGTG